MKTMNRAGSKLVSKISSPKNARIQHSIQEEGYFMTELPSNMMNIQ